MFKFINILVPILLFTSRMYGQEAILSQPYSSSQYQNPAGVGGGEYDKRFQSNYKFAILPKHFYVNVFETSQTLNYLFACYKFNEKERNKLHLESLNSYQK